MRLREQSCSMKPVPRRCADFGFRAVPRPSSLPLPMPHTQGKRGAARRGVRRVPKPVPAHPPVHFKAGPTPNSPPSCLLLSPSSRPRFADWLIRPEPRFGSLSRRPSRYFQRQEREDASRVGRSGTGKRGEGGRDNQLQCNPPQE